MPIVHTKASDMTALADAVNLIHRKYPDDLPQSIVKARKVFRTGLSTLDGLFPGGGIPYGQLIEVIGSTSCGKTSLMLHILARLVKKVRVAYVDSSNSFFSGAAVACGVDINQLLVVKPRNLSEALRTTELLLRHKLVGCVACDLVAQRGTVTVAQLHRLRIHTVRCKGLVFFVTENNSPAIPPSMMSLQLKVNRKDATTVLVTVTKSRISPEGAQAEVTLHER